MNVTDTSDIVAVRQQVRVSAVSAGLSLLEQTKVATAASELLRNMVEYAGKGWVRIELITNGIRQGVRVTFTDTGPGIEDVQLAMQNGFTTGRGLGVGLAGAKRLVDEFEIESTPGQGTRIVITKWKAR